MYGQIDRRMMYRTIRYGQYSVCAALVKAEGTSVLPAVPLASHNPINGGNENKEGENGREIRKRGREWMNWKELEGSLFHAIMDRKWCHFA